MQCYQLHRSVISPVILTELIGSCRVGGRNKIMILTKSLLFQNLEEQIPSCKISKKPTSRRSKTQTIENYHLHKWRHYIKMLNQPGRSGSRTKPTRVEFNPASSSSCFKVPVTSALHLAPKSTVREMSPCFLLLLLKSISDLIFLNSDLFSRSSLISKMIYNL